MCVTLALAPGRDVAGRESAAATADLVDAVNGIVESDIPIRAAASAACSADRLPGSVEALLPLVPAEHRRLIRECSRGRVRVRRQLTGFDLLGRIEHSLDRTDAEVAIRGFFAERSVDVAVGTGLSDGPYPLSFDWVVVLDPHSRTLVSFVLNCRD